MTMFRSVFDFKNAGRVLAGLTILMAGAAPGRANVIYNSYSADSSFNGSALLTQGYTNNDPTWRGIPVYQGNKFTLAADSTITNLRFVGLQNQVDSYNWIIMPAADMNNYFSISSAATASAFGVSNTVLGPHNSGYIINFDVNFALAAGSYFLVFHDNSTTQPYQNIGLSHVASDGILADTFGDFIYPAGSGTAEYSVEIDGAPIVTTPLPSAAVLFGSGLGGVLLLRRRRRAGS